MSTTVIILGVAVIAAAILIAAVLTVRVFPDTLRSLRTAWHERIYPRLVSVHAELRRLPESDEERLRALELALSGITICVFGILFPLLLPVGAIMFYYGARKIGAALLRIRTKE